MKEVKRLIGMLITNEFKDIKFISSSSYRNVTTHFNDRLSSSYLVKHVEDLISKSKITEELSDLQRKLFDKQTEFIKSLTKATKKDINEELENDGERASRWRSETEPDTKLFDDFNAIRNASQTIQRILYKRLEATVEKFVEKLNHYINEVEARVFDAYTKGMTTDDFLSIVKEEIKEFRTERDEIAKELEDNGYEHND
jgi:cob(I)alamin adenosyltransferase